MKYKDDYNAYEDRRKTNMSNTELNDLRIVIYLRKTEVITERCSVCNVIENLMEHAIHCHAPIPMMS